MGPAPCLPTPPEEQDKYEEIQRDGNSFLKRGSKSFKVVFYYKGMSCVSLGMSGIKKAKVVPTQVQSLSESHSCVRDVAIVHSLPVQVLFDID